MTPYRMRFMFRYALGRLAVFVVLLASALAQQDTTVEERLQREAMKKFEFLVGKWVGEARWFTSNGTLDLVATEDVHYEQHGVTLKINARELSKFDSKLIGRSDIVISYDDKSETYHLHEGSTSAEGTLKIDDDWRGMTIQFELPKRTTWEMLRVNEQGEWAELNWVGEGSDPPRMFLQAVVRRQKKLRPENSRP